MGKSASSSKKTKRSKDSSKLRSVRKKKTKRNKSKKIRPIKDYSDESDSGFSGSDSSLYSSSSEDDYRREKRRSKVSKKKRSRKRYSSSESDNDDDGIRLLKKKKSSKRKDEHVGTKKKKKKRTVSRKRRKRDSSSSYTSSDSYSIRDDQSDDGSESDGKRRARDRGRLSEFKDARRRSKDGLEEESECLQVEDEVMTEKNPRRLKSIVVVSYNYGNDERNEDMGADHDDASDENKIVDERDGEARISYPRSGADENGRETFGYDEFEEDIRSEASKVSYADNSLKDDDLEAILKKRALENLKRFRGETQKNGISSKDVSSVSEGEETLQIESGKVEESQDGLMEQKLCVSVEGKDLETSQKILQVVNVKESGIGLADLASQQEQQPGDNAKVKPSSGFSSCTTKRKLIRPVLGQECLSLASRKEAAGCHDAEADKNFPESSLALATNNGGGENREPTKVSSTSSSHAETEPLDETKGGSQSEQKTIDETKDESQFEKKTMNVMRGGESVQVSYKVYIPKKTSSLGRRLLRR